MTHQPVDERATDLTFDGSIRSQVAPGAAAQVMDELLEPGIGLAFDDFGTGHSSLSDRQRFAFS
ncbi:MAG: hypothetical protein KDK75_07440 [Alphaproteobacteria bacterium]|nr:hypothetical protein [Alphaproteobacteria bacterium]